MTQSPVSTTIPFVDLAAQHAEIRAELDAAVRDILDTSAFIGGKPVRAFEEELATNVGAKYAVGTASCTASISLALIALGVGPGDEVVTTTHTYIATVEAILWTGASARLIDVAPGNHLSGPAEFERAITPKTRAIVPVHLYGTPCDMDALLALARPRGVAVIEDCAQSHGSLYKGRPTGSIGDAGCFSFFPSKNLGAAGDAGAIATNDPKIAERARMFANHGRLDKFNHEVVGYNHRLDTLQAAILRVKLRHLARWNDRRRAAMRLYNRLLAGAPGVGLPVEPAYADTAPHLYAVRLADRERVRAELKKRGVETGIHYPKPVHLHPAVASLGLGPGSLPNAERYCAETLSLPMHGAITDAQVESVCRALRDVV